MIYGLVHKGQSKWYMFLVFGEQIKSSCSEQSKLSFWNRLHTKVNFDAISWHKQPPDKQTFKVLPSSVNAIWKTMINTVLLAPSLGEVRVYYLQWEVFLTRESTMGLIRRVCHERTMGSFLDSKRNYSLNYLQCIKNSSLR